MEFYEHENPRIESTRIRARAAAERLGLDTATVEAAVDRLRTVGDTEEHHERRLVSDAIVFVSRKEGRQ